MVSRLGLDWEETLACEVAAIFGDAEGMINRRRDPRVREPPLRVTGLPALVCDVSLGGVRLALRSALEVGEQVRLVLVDEEDGTTQELTAEVRWCRRNQAGLRWAELGSAEKEWLDRRISRWRTEGALRPASVLR